MTANSINWVHSTNDLGGPATQLDLAVQPLNNLFPNTSVAVTDYRCFYIVNNLIGELVKDVVVAISVTGGCSLIAFGSQVQNAQQYILVNATPGTTGYVILAVPVWGFPVTCYYNGSWSAFAASLQSSLQQGSYCAGITVVLDTTYSTSARFLVTFGGDLQNHKMGLIQVIQNNLITTGISEYRLLPSATCNASANSCVDVTKTITDIPTTGQLWLFNYVTYSYAQFTYTSYSGSRFTLSSPIGFNTNPGDEVWVQMSTPQPVATVDVFEKQDGYPIGQEAAPISLPTNTPNWTNAGSSLSVGTLAPNEGFFLWVQRNSTLLGCTDSFTLDFTGEVYTYP